MTSNPSRDSVLPAADYLVISWTVAETRAMAAIFTPGYNLQKWYSYAHNFDSKFKSRLAEGAPATETHILGRYFQSQVQGKKVLLFKSELHFTTDGLQLPLLDLLQQVINESGAKIVVTTGTSGPIGRGFQVGDVFVASRGIFRLNKDFKSADYNGKIVSSNVAMPATQFELANRNLFKANAFKLSFMRQTGPANPRIYWDSSPQPNMFVTTDYFAFDDIRNHYNLRCAGSVIESNPSSTVGACLHVLTH
jgi:hypothetical protein